MTKSEAIRVMRSGMPVTHATFNRYKHVRIEENRYITYGYATKQSQTATVFWSEHTWKHWDDGWELWEPLPQQ